MLCFRAGICQTDFGSIAAGRRFKGPTGPFSFQLRIREGSDGFFIGRFKYLGSKIVKRGAADGRLRFEGKNKW